MIKIQGIPPEDDFWDKWVADCRAATQEIIHKYNTSGVVDVKKEVYDGKKYDLKNLYYFNSKKYYYGKCAYCETKITTNQPGDVEHFRPKAGVDVTYNNPLNINIGDVQIKHPGYYWLAYFWRNLLPSCKDCNTPTKFKTPNMVGKGNLFPIEDERVRAISPGSEDAEYPLFINPIIDDPSEHIGIDETGILFAKTDKGRKTIDVLGLNDRESLVEERKKAVILTKSHYISYICECIRANRVLNDDIIDGAYCGSAQYAMACRFAINEAKKICEMLK